MLWLCPQDSLRWSGGCKVMLLYAFVVAMGDNMERLGEIRSVLLGLLLGVVHPYYFCSIKLAYY